MFQVVLIVGIAGACRRVELCKMKIEDIKEFETHLVVTVPDTKTHVDRQFVVYVEGFSSEINNISIFKKYRALRPDHTAHTRLFIAYKKGRCTIQPLGINTFGKIPSQIASYLKLSSPKEYTGHCYRRTSATLLVDAGGDIMSLKRHGGWKSSSVAEGYIENSVQNKIGIAKQINGVEEYAERTSCFSKSVNFNSCVSSDSKTLPSSISFGNVTNSTININIS